MMTITTYARSLLLLTATLGRPGAAVPPLDGIELDRVLAWLKRTRLSAADLLEPELAERLSGTPDAPVSLDRLTGLLDRPALLDAVLERWEGSGIWVIGRDDPDYPRRVKRRLRDEAPALLFGRGDRLLLNRGGIAVVGGDEPDAGAVAGLTTISGLGNPVEDAAMEASLSHRGFVVAVLAGDLRAQDADARLRGSMDRLVLVSETEPGGVAEGSARCIYGVADAALLIGVGRNSDRWADTVGAIEKEWLPHWVRAGDAEAGTLIRLGAHPVADEEAAPRTLLSPPRPARLSTRRSMGSSFPATAPQPVMSGFAEAAEAFPVPPPQPLLQPPAGFRPSNRSEPSGQPQSSNQAPSSSQAQSSNQPQPSTAPGERGAHLRLVEPHPRPVAPPVQAEQPAPEPSLYEVFGRQVEMLLRSGPLGAARIAEAMELTRPQADAWLLRAEGEAVVELDPGTRLYRLP